MKRRNFIKAMTALGAGLGTQVLSADTSNFASKNGAQPEDEIFDVAIIGAGLSGLVAARDLKKSGHHVVVIEAKTRVGGRTMNQISRQGVIVDAGGQWIGPSQTEIIALADELEINTFKTWTSGESLTLVQGQVYPDSVIEPSPAESIAYLNAVSLIDEWAFTIQLDAPWTARGAKEMDAQLVSQWLLENIPLESVRERINGGIASILAAPSSEISLLWFLFYVHSGGGWDSLQTIEDGAQDSRFVGGAQSLSNKMATELAENIVLGNPVRKIEQEHDYVEIELQFGKVKARRVIVAMMPADATRIEFQPALPAIRQGLNSNWATASGVKVQAIYDSPFWRSQNLSGIATTDTAVSSIFDNSPDDKSYGVLLAFIEITYLPTDPTERKQEILAVFASLFGAEAQNPVDFIEKDWNIETYNSGCESPLRSGTLTTYGAALRDPVGLVHWAGTETALQWNGYMEGAVRAGKRAASEVATLLY